MKIYSTLFAVVVSFGAWSCDVCGGVATVGTQGLLPGNGYHFLGLSTSYSGFLSRHDDHFNETTAYTKEYFFAGTLQARWQFSQRFNAMFELPFKQNIQVEEGTQYSQTGLGDIKLWVNHLAVKINQESDERFISFQYGLGVKLPTGNYSRDAWESSNLYPGSGAWDGFLTSRFVFRKKKLGWTQENSFTLKGTNPATYKFGNILLVRASGFYQHKMKQNRNLIPLIGASYSYTGTDQISGIDVDYLFNSGQTVNAEVGLNVITPKWMFMSQFSYPMYQNIGDGDVSSRGTLTLGIYYLMQKKN